MREHAARGRSADRTRMAGDAPAFPSCFWCERIHRGDHPLSVCSACAAAFATLRSLEMSGSYPLSDAAIDRALTRTSPGNYALGYMDGPTFEVFYVGRSDDDVRRRLHEWVGMPSRSGTHASPAKAPWQIQRRGSLPLQAPAPRWVGRAESGYTHFAYRYARSADEAYAREWRNYDGFGGRHALDNPAPPAASPECIGPA